MTRKIERPAGAGRKTDAGQRPHSKQRNQPQYSTDGTDGRVPVRNHHQQIVGWMTGGVLCKEAGPGHMLETPRGWAWDEAILDQARAHGCTWTEIYDRTSGLLYRALLADFTRYGVPINRGHGAQRVLPLARWTIARPGEEPPVGEAPPDNQPPGAAPAVVQLSLW